MVEVYRSGTPYEAHLVRHVLKEQGIRSVIVGEALIGYHGEDHWGLLNSICVIVPAAEAQRAYQVVADLPVNLQHAPWAPPVGDDIDPLPVDSGDGDGTFIGDGALPPITFRRRLSVWIWSSLLTVTFGLVMITNGDFEIVVLAMLVGLVVSMLVLPALGE